MVEIEKAAAACDPAIARILEKVLAGHEVSVDEGELLFTVAGAELAATRVNRAKELLQLVDRDREVEVLRAGTEAAERGRADADHLAAHVEERAAGVARGDRRGDLDSLSRRIGSVHGAKNSFDEGRRILRTWMTHRNMKLLRRRLRRKSARSTLFFHSAGSHFTS